MKDLMIDIETFGTKPGSAILSIGAVFFDPLTDKLGGEFSVKIHFGSCLRAGLTMDSQTVEWWLNQSEQARSGILPDALTLALPHALHALAYFIGVGCAHKDVRPWGNAASFDITLLESAYQACGIEIPWRFYNVMCYRTLKNLNILPKEMLSKPDVAHDALSDAKAQARNAIALLLRLGGPTPKSEAGNV